MAKSVPDPVFPDNIWDGTTDKWPDITTDKTPDTGFGAQYRAEIRSLESVLDFYTSMLDTILAYGAANTILGVKGDGTELEYKTLVAGTDILITHNGTTVTFDVSGGGVTTVDKTNDNAGTIIIGQPVYVKSNDNVDLAQADDVNTTQVVGLVADATIAATATGEIITAGVLVATTVEWDAVAGTTGGLTPGAIYYLDAGAAGQLTETPPASIGEYVCQVGYAASVTEMVIEVEAIVLVSVPVYLKLDASNDPLTGDLTTLDLIPDTGGDKNIGTSLNPYNIGYFKSGNFSSTVLVNAVLGNLIPFADGGGALGNFAGNRWAAVAAIDGYIANDLTVGGTLLVSGVATIIGVGDGGLTSYDLKVGDTDGTPTYGMVQIGNTSVGRTSYKAGNIDLDGALMFRNIAGPVTSEIEFIWTESTGGTTRFALPKSGVGNATYNSRSMLLAGPAPANTDFVKVGFWQANPYQIFHNLVCDTASDGADLGVQNDLEVEGDIFTDSIKESTPAAGITFANDVKLAGNNRKLFLGAGENFSTYYDGVDAVFNSREVGSGDYHFKDGDIKLVVTGYESRLYSLQANPGAALTSGTLTISSAGNMYFRPGASGTHIFMMSYDNPDAILEQQRASINFKLGQQASTTDVVSSPFYIYGQDAYASAVTNLDGGDIFLDGGAKAGAGADGNIIVCATRGDLKLQRDDAKLLFGDTGNFSIYYDGVDAVFDSQEVGAGDFNFKSGTLNVEGIQTIYNAQALDSFAGSLIIGNGGTNLSHVAGDEGYYNTFIGIGSGRDNTTGAFNTSLGAYSFDKNLTGVSNVSIGYHSLRVNTSGHRNTGVGYQTLRFNTLGDDNVAQGFLALGGNTGGLKNTAVGGQALSTSITTDSSTGIGYRALYTATGQNNTSLGAFSLSDLTSGEGNVATGYNTGRGITIGNYNTIIGAQVTGLASGLSNYVIIADGQGNQRIVVDNNGNAEINGDLKIDGKFSTGTTTVSATGPTNNVDVGACNVVFLDTSSNNVTIGGFVNGVVGQVIRVVRLDSANNAVLEHNEGTGNQDIFLATEADQTISTYGGWELVCNGTHWYEVGYTPETTTVSAVGPTDNVDVTACNTVFIDTSSNTVTIGGFTNGFAGQVIRVVRLDNTNSATLEHNEGGGSQDIFLAAGKNQTLTSYGGWTLVCNGSDWYEVGHKPGGGVLGTDTATISAAGPTDNVDVGDCKILYVDSSSNNVTISGFINGSADQILQVVRISASNSVILQHNNSASQDLMLWGETNKTLSTIGGWTLVCDGTDWWEVTARAA